jgi:hypothetical protein
MRSHLALRLQFRTEGTSDSAQFPLFGDYPLGGKVGCECNRDFATVTNRKVR